MKPEEKARKHIDKLLTAAGWQFQDYQKLNLGSSSNLVWQAYEKLEQSRVRGAGPQKLLTNIISLIRFALGESSVLEPFSQTVDHRFNDWLAQQQRSGKAFTEEQMEWLRMIKEHIATSLSIGMDDFEYAPFHER